VNEVIIYIILIMSDKKATVGRKGHKPLKIKVASYQLFDEKLIKSNKINFTGTVPVLKKGGASSADLMIVENHQEPEIIGDTEKDVEFII
jgi:hypothetical protein